MKIFYSHFILETRNELSVLLRTDVSKTDIARVLKKTRKSIQEELGLNGEKNGSYPAENAHSYAMQRRKKSKVRYWKIEQNLLLKI